MELIYLNEFKQIDITEYLDFTDNNDELNKIKTLEPTTNIEKEIKYTCTHVNTKYNIIDYDNKYRPNVMETIRFIHLFADKLGISYEYAKPQFDALMDVVTDALVNNDKVTLKYFGVFKVVHRKEKVGYNYRYDKYTPIPACEMPVFQPSKELKELINKQREDN